jgi:transcriptional regulator with XRE-family HTH domain
VAITIEPFYKEIGRKIQARRGELRISQETLGLSLEPQVTRASIANIEAGKQRILAHTLVQLADVLGTDLSRLIPNTNNRTATPANQVEAKLAAHNIPSKTIRRLSAQFKASRGEKNP